MRATAVLLVFCTHSTGVFLALVGRFGWAGVDLFFVLSGFLVSGLLFREYQLNESIASGYFLLRRGFKIYPQFYVLIAASVIFPLGAAEPHPRAVLSELLFIQNYAVGLWTHTWSLAVEEHFYLLLGLVLAFLSRRGGSDPFRGLPAGIAIVSAIILGLRILTWVFRPELNYRIYQVPSHLRMDSMLAGVLIAYLHTFRGEDLVRWIRHIRGFLPMGSILLLSPITFLPHSDPFMRTLGLSLAAWGFALLLLSVLYPARPMKTVGPIARAMIRLGQVSYGFYLWHAPILYAGDQARVNYETTRGIVIPMWIMSLVTLGATTLMAFLTTWLVETPCLRLRDRWFPSRSTRTVTPDLADPRALAPRHLPSPETP